MQQSNPFIWYFSPAGSKKIFQVLKVTKMLISIRFQFIFWASLYSVQMHMFRSSYFKISSQSDMKTKEDFFFAKTVQDETSCASTCNADTHCHSALFDRISKKCSLLRAKENFQSQDTVEPREKILLEKVSWKFALFSCNHPQILISFIPSWMRWNRRSPPGRNKLQL